MLEYPIDEAEQLLTRNLSQAQSSLKQVEEDLDHIRDQCTTLEVGILFFSMLVLWDRQVFFPVPSLLV